MDEKVERTTFEEVVKKMDDEELVERTKAIDVLIRDMRNFGLSDMSRRELCLDELEERGLLEEYEEHLDDLKKTAEKAEEYFSDTGDDELMEHTRRVYKQWLISLEIDEGGPDQDLDDEYDLCLRELSNRGMYHIFVNTRDEIEEMVGPVD